MFKDTITHLFDDDVQHHGWQLWTRRAIISLIIISGALSFFETFASINMHWQDVMFVVDCIIIGIFSIEVALRIWVGGWKYIFSFYGAVDITSTYPFYLAFIFPIPYALLRILRVLRLLRALRYMRATKFLTRAIKSKQKEIWISLQFLVVITFILSIMLYHVEHSVQPEIYENGFSSVSWAFAQYIGDPGGFGDYTPTTTFGKIIACIVGVLGICIFAVPAGILGSAFVDTMDEDKKAETDSRNLSDIQSMFRRRQCRDTYMRTCPPFFDLASIQVKLMLDEKEIIDAVNTSADLRLINLGATYPQGSVLPSLIAVERFPINAPYGTFIDRGSNITIIATSCPLEPCLSWVSWYIALFGGFNFVAKQHEINHSHTSVSSFYNIPLDPEKRDLNLKKFIEDINSLSRTDMRNCNICLLTSSFGDEPDYPTQMHFTFGASRGDETYGDVEHLTIKDIPTFDAMFNDMSEMLGEFGMTIDHHRFHKSNINNLTNHIMPESEKFTIRMSADFTIRNQHRVLIIHKMAEIIRKHYAPNTPMPDSAQFKIAGDGYEL